VLAAVAAALTGINAALPPATPTVPVVSAASHLDGGRVLTAVDLKLVRVPEQLVPQGALTDLTTAIGRSVRAPVPRGQLLSDLSVISPSRSVRSGRVVAPLRLADGDVAALLTVGDVVDVLAADSDTRKAAVVASGVRVVGLPSLAADPGGGALSGAGAAANSSSMSGALVLVEVDSRTATLLAQAAVTSTLSVVLR
jgi:pilus assembly protein CpaB